MKALFALGLAVLSLVHSCGAERPLKRVLIVGDSIVWQADPSLRFIAAGDKLVALTVWGVGGSALCDQIPRLRGPDGSPFDVVVIDFAGNALTPCMAQRNVSYAETAYGYVCDFDIAVRIARSRGQQVIVVGNPDEHPVGKVIPVVRTKLFAEASRLGISMIDLSQQLATMPRAPDGLHLCAPAVAQTCASATTYAVALLSNLYHVLGLR